MPRKAHSMAFSASSQGALFLLSPLCFSGLAGHSNGLIRTFYQLCDYRGLTRCVQNIYEHFWPNARIIGLTIAMHLSGTKVTFSGAIRGCSQLCMTVKQWLLWFIGITHSSLCSL